MAEDAAAIKAAFDAVDQSKPSIARVYDYILGGKDNYVVDQQIGDHFKKDLPGSVAIAFTNRQAMVRAIRDMTQAGMRQFIDFGSGLPTADNVHQVAERYAPDARVVYVDNDPIVLAHGRALLATNHHTTVIQADLREPKTIQQHPEVARLIDFDQPVGVVFSAILHHVNDDEHPGELVREWTDRVAPGSLVYISHFRSGHNAETEAAQEKLLSTFGRGTWRSDAEIEALFGDLEILEPGIKYCAQWRPDDQDAAIGQAGRELSIWEHLIVSGLARKN
ncbi:SAM-dependent methyltransferase [Nocardia panacis]|uniref:SAM-dependent methyltransferase n=1 Tax=Nocardia panacis TaxID=2340916 RepID=A0A3A4KA48_9NOCA|nr:SAM-dependent methyltransferase [Nocardia panacis]RJO78462.1 SAM-dependent methyltransferase [Nocardia panacis]